MTMAILLHLGTEMETALKQEAFHAKTNVTAFVRGVLAERLGMNVQNQDAANEQIAAILATRREITFNELRTLVPFTVTNATLSTALSAAGFTKKNLSWVRLSAPTKVPVSEMLRDILKNKAEISVNQLRELAPCTVSNGVLADALRDSGFIKKNGVWVRNWALSQEKIRAALVHVRNFKSLDALRGHLPDHLMGIPDFDLTEILKKIGGFEIVFGAPGVKSEYRRPSADVLNSGDPEVVW